MVFEDKRLEFKNQWYLEDLIGIYLKNGGQQLF